MSIGPIERVSLSNVATDHLRQAIYAGTFRPGERIVVDQIAKMLRTSGGPVRDAISRLEHEGLIVRERNQGAVVVALSLQDIHEIGSLRLAIEMTGLTWTVEKVSETDLAALEQILAQLSIQIETQGGRAANQMVLPHQDENPLPLVAGILARKTRNQELVQGTLTEMVKLDLEFHERLIRLSGHRRLFGAWEALRSQLWFLICSYKMFRRSGYQAPSHADHLELVGRLRERDLDGAQRCLRDHLNASTADFVTAYNARLHG